MLMIGSFKKKYKDNKDSCEIFPDLSVLPYNQNRK